MTEKTPQFPAQIAPKPVRHRAISKRVRHAITLKAEKGLTGEQAAKAAGLSPAGFWKAWQRQDVKELHDAMQQRIIDGIDRKRAILKARALDTAEDILANSTDDRIRARMVEFLAGEPKPGASVAVQVNVDRGGYEFVRPGARMVDITPLPDDASGGDDVQEPDNQ